MTIKEVLSILGTILGISAAICFIPFLMYIVFPFFHSLSPEKKFEKFVDDKCLQGNEIAILIRREGTRYYYDKDYKLVKAAIEGNDHAIKALKLDTETQKRKIY